MHNVYALILSLIAAFKRCWLSWIRKLRTGSFVHDEA